MTDSEPKAVVDPQAFLGGLPFFLLLPEDVRRLVAYSFEPVTFPFGAVLVREGEPADSFYLLVSGTARVVKESDGFGEVPLNLLRAGDSFGEIGLLEETTRVATVRASSDLHALKLDRTVFRALAQHHPRCASTSKCSRVSGRSRTSFDCTPPSRSFLREGIASMSRELEALEVAGGDAVVREGEPAGPMYIVEEGRLHAFRERRTDSREDLAFLRKGDFFGERALFRDEPRHATVARALRLAGCCASTRRSSSGCSSEYPEFRERIEQRIAQYDYETVARVPLDFAEEILPAEVAATEALVDREVAGHGARRRRGRRTSPTPTRRPPTRRGRGFPHVYQLDEMDCGAACLAMVCAFTSAGTSACPTSASSCRPRPTARA